MNEGGFSATGERWWLAGSGGAGMQALAAILQRTDAAVLRVDSSVVSTWSSPRQQGFAWFWDVTERDFLSGKLPRRLQDWLRLSGGRAVASAALPADHHCRTAATEWGWSHRTLLEAVNEQFSGRTQIAVAGTHGKTSTCGYLAWALQAAGRNPGWFLGAPFTDGTLGGRGGTGDVAVVEACEYRRAFLSLSPDVLILTAIDYDHVDCFPTPHDQVAAFQQLIARLPPHGKLVFDADCPVSRELANASPAKCHPYRREQAVVGEEGSQSTRTTGAFSVERRSPLGDHTLKNIAAAQTAAGLVGLDAREFSAAIRSFPGLHRRMQYRGTVRGVWCLDDYAHHPTEIAATLRELRRHFPNRRLIAVVEPHQRSRLFSLFSGFTDSLEAADLQWVLPVFPARENLSRRECLDASRRLVETLVHRKAAATLCPSLDDVVKRFEDSTLPNDVLITLGAGQAHFIHDELHRRIQRDSAA